MYQIEVSFFEPDLVTFSILYVAYVVVVVGGGVLPPGTTIPGMPEAKSGVTNWHLKRRPQFKKNFACLFIIIL